MAVVTDAGLPRSIAIAGAWGYIGRKFLDVAVAHGLPTWVYDPGPLPPDLDPAHFTRVADPAEFERLDAEVVHLAVHPEHRHLDRWLTRDRPPVLLVEKPMAEPSQPEACRRIIETAAASEATVLYDFPELYDPITQQILEFLGSFDCAEIDTIRVQRSKDREDVANPRNRKRMVTIQYQESVHCLAFVLRVLAAIHRGNARVALGQGVEIAATADLYQPPNPEDYPEPVDGRCRFTATIGKTRVDGLTDFKAGAPWAKIREIRGRGDGRHFAIVASYLEGAKSLSIDGVARPVDPDGSSYESVLRTLTGWTRSHSRATLMSDPYPHPGFAWLTYQLSAALWWSSTDRAPVAFADATALDRFPRP